MIKKIKILAISLAIVLSSLSSIAGGVALATTAADSGAGAAKTPAKASDSCHPENDTYTDGSLIGKQPLTKQQLQSCEDCKKGAANCLQKNPIVKDLNAIINVLSAGVGIVVVAMIIIGGIQYSAAGDNPQLVAAARKRITNALIALLTFMLIYSFLQWLVPGGVFG